MVWWLGAGPSPDEHKKNIKTKPQSQVRRPPGGVQKVPIWEEENAQIKRKKMK